MIHRIFIAINVPENIKKKLLSFQQEVEDMFEISPIRWTKKDNLHITLVFLGNCSDQEVAEICQSVKKASQNKEPFFINLNTICLGPPNKSPRIVWVEGDKNQELTQLQISLEENLLENSTPAEGGTRPVFSPHLTLGRIRQWQWRQIDPEERPEIEKEISLSFEVHSIEVMESQLKPRGPEYTILESVPLG